ncbi:type II secretion system protein GspG [Nitrosomonas sp. PY1]|uniref:prepilin-type N-terminal cleavage/methylation domain-containing protein n=1 Tax=Nitrosomonas sp. PY1 TaxID=1803906 RepID=UPI001FC81774|nr:prepilin-type N-terminal cleavage/methylation domain-containing protein [Nitrosomonas sp. PY1]GKS68629.1 type II secretion system protein GspG [Nitrosomonas sp. PY1]
MSRLKVNFHFQRAFTLIELLIVMAIISVLAVVAVPVYSDYIDRARAVQAITDISAIAKSLVIYQMSVGKLPATLVEVGAQGYLDPWKNPYQYLNLSDPSDKNSKGKARKDHNLVPINSDFDLYSMGKDGRSVSPLTAKASRDDIVRANNGRYVGLASEY